MLITKISRVGSPLVLQSNGITLNYFFGLKLCLILKSDFCFYIFVNQLFVNNFSYRHLFSKWLFTYFYPKNSTRKNKSAFIHFKPNKNEQNIYWRTTRSYWKNIRDWTIKKWNIPNVRFMVIWQNKVLRILLGKLNFQEIANVSFLKCFIG